MSVPTPGTPERAAYERGVVVAESLAKYDRAAVAAYVVSLATERDPQWTDEMFRAHVRGMASVLMPDEPEPEPDVGT